MGVLEPVPYIGVWEPYIGVRPCADVIPLCLLAPLERQRGKKAELILRSEQRHIRKWTDQVRRFTAVCSRDYEKTTEQISSKRSGGMEHGSVHFDVDLEMFHLFLNIMIFSFCTNTHVKHACTYMVVKRCRSTEMVWQVEWSSTRAVDSVASFTTPMYPGKRTRREKASASSLWKTRRRPGGDDSTDQTSVTWSFCRLTFVRSLRNTNRLTNQLIVSPTSAPSHSSSSSSTSSTTTSSSSSCSSSGSSCSSSSLLSTWTTTATQHQALSKFLVRSLNYKVTKTNPIKWNEDTKLGSDFRPSRRSDSSRPPVRSPTSPPVVHGAADARAHGSESSHREVRHVSGLKEQTRHKLNTPCDPSFQKAAQ